MFEVSKAVDLLTQLMCWLEPIFKESNLPQSEGAYHFVFLPDVRLAEEHEGSTGSVVRGLSGWTTGWLIG